MVVMICWEDTCTSLKNVTKCIRCGRSWCEEHMGEIGLCVWCLPIDDDEYAKWAKIYEENL